MSGPTYNGVVTTLFSKEGKKISTYTAKGISKTELKAISGIYNAKDVKK